MHNSYAHSAFEPTLLGDIKLCSKFGGASELAQSQNKAFQALKDIAENVSSSDTDELVMNPYKQGLKQRVFTKILNNAPQGEILDYIYRELDGQDAEKIREALADFMHEFEDMGLTDMANELRLILSNQPAPAYTPPAPNILAPTMMA